MGGRKEMRKEVRRKRGEDRGRRSIKANKGILEGRETGDGRKMRGERRKYEGREEKEESGY